MNAAEIAPALGSARRWGAWWRCRCPVHESRGPTLALRDGDRGLVAHCHAGCEPRDVLAELRRRGLVGGGDEREPELVKPRRADRDDEDADAARRATRARRIWGAAQDASRSPVARYLAGRGITMPLPASLRYAPAPRCPDGTRRPAMVGRIDGIDDELIGVHRTWLDRDQAGQWHRLDRAMLGRAAGGAVRLASASETLLIAEGLETTLAGMQATGLSGWAALSTSGMVALILPPSVRAIIILADHDCTGAGERAARIAATRWLAEGRQVRIALPPEPGTDFNDVLIGRANLRITEARDVAA